MRKPPGNLSRREASSRYRLRPARTEPAVPVAVRLTDSTANDGMNQQPSTGALPPPAETSSAAKPALCKGLLPQLTSSPAQPAHKFRSHGGTEIRSSENARKR
jgi:hypothetical protein